LNIIANRNVITHSVIAKFRASSTVAGTGSRPAKNRRSAASQAHPPQPEHERDHRDHRHARALLARAHDGGLDGLRPGPADQELDLLDNGPTRGLGAEEDTGQRDEHDEARREREQGVEGQRGAKPLRSILVPLAGGVAKDLPRLAQAAEHDHEPLIAPVSRLRQTPASTGP
jgi:hypothetical protein